MDAVISPFASFLSYKEGLCGLFLWVSFMFTSSSKEESIILSLSDDKLLNKSNSPTVPANVAIAAA